jgi:hypothetical protein
MSNKCNCDTGNSIVLFSGDRCEKRILGSLGERNFFFFWPITGYDNDTKQADVNCISDPTSNCCPDQLCVFTPNFHPDQACIHGKYNWQRNECDCDGPWKPDDINQDFRCLANKCGPVGLTPCYGNGECVGNGVCFCNDGWTGQYCNIPTTLLCPPFSFANPADGLSITNITAICGGRGDCVVGSKIDKETLINFSYNNSIDPSFLYDQVQMKCDCFTSRDGKGGFNGSVCEGTYYTNTAACLASPTTAGSLSVLLYRLVP